MKVGKKCEALVHQAADHGNEPSQQGLVRCVGGVMRVGGAAGSDDAHEVMTACPLVTLSDTAVWEEGQHPAPNSLRLASALARTGFMFRDPQDRLLRLESGQAPEAIAAPVRLQAALDAHVYVEVFNANGNFKGHRIRKCDLELFLATPEFLQPIPAVNIVVNHNTFSKNWQMTTQGYNEFGPGQRFFQICEDIEPRPQATLVRSFIETMDFDCRASATNTIAAALIRLLRHRWQGQKPFVPITATRSHLGKDAALQFIAGPGKWVDVSWERADWAVQNQIVELLNDPHIAVVSLGNVRAAGSIASAFLERIVTTPHLDLQKSSGHSRYQRPNDVLFAATANEGTFSADLLNRAWPINLHREGDIAERECPLGNLRNEFLPTYCMAIEGELLGMIQNWRDHGQPRFMEVRHPMTDCTQIIGGILQVNGFQDFLANWGQTRALIDPVMEELGMMAATHPDTPLTAMEWVRVIRRTGSVNRLIPKEFRKSDQRVAECLGKLLSARAGMVVYSENDERERNRYRIAKHRSRMGQGEARVRYAFETEEQ